MEGGIFLLLCLLALVIGNNARKTREQKLSEKEIRRKEKFKHVMTWSALVLIIAFLMFFIPALIYDIKIALDTRFDNETWLGIALLIVAIFTIITIVKRLRK